MKAKKFFRMFGTVFLVSTVLVSASLIREAYAGEVVTWKCFLGAPGTWETKGWPELANAIAAGTNGRLKINIFQFGEHPYKGPDLLKAVRDGEAEIVQVGSPWVSGVEPRLAVQDMPLLVPKGDFKLTREIYKEFQKSYRNKVLAEWNCRELIVNYWGQADFFLKDIWIEDFDSLKGKRVRAFSPEVADLIKLMGGTPVMMEFGECYTAIQTGLINGVACSANGAYGTRLTEILKNINIMAFVNPTSPFAVNLKALNALPPDLKDMLWKVIEAKQEWFEKGGTMASAMDLRGCFDRDGASARPIPKEFREQLRQRAYEAIWSHWIDRAGPAGKDAFNALAKIIIRKGIKIPGYKPY